MMKRFLRGTFPIDISAQRDAGDFLFTEKRYLDNHLLPKHSHECACFVLVSRGSFVDVIGSRERICGSTDVIFRLPGETHSNRFGRSGAHCLTIEISAKRQESSFAEFLSQDGDRYFSSAQLATLQRRLFLEFRESDHASKLSLEGLSLELVAAVSRRKLSDSSERVSAKVEQASEIIREQFTSDLTLSNLASLVGLHPVHLAREFRRRYRLTVGEYVRHYRIAEACKLLSNSELKIVEIALDNGFLDQSHFSKSFKRIMGVTPARYRALHR